MMKQKYRAIIGLFMACLMYSCTETQDEHYARSASLPEENLRELIAGDAQLSVFSRLVEIAAYDSLLASTQTFTVWAADNDALADVDLNAVAQEEARLIVGNHIARFTHPTSTPEKTRLIEMKNKKAYYFSDGGQSFGGVPIGKHDMPARNGLLHIVKARIPYHPNIYEYILSTPNTSYLGGIIRRFDEQVFDEYASIPIDVDESGRTVYDTVTVPFNRLFDIPILSIDRYGNIRTGLGQINNEDSTYTMLVPDNQAWEEVYQRMFPYFKSTQGDSVQHLQTSLEILENLIYRGKIDNPAGYDSLISTSPSIINDPSHLFAGSEKIQTSNGLIFQTGRLQYDNQETWNKSIYVEADWTEGREVGTNTTIFIRTQEGQSDIMATDSRYLEVYGSATSTQPKVIFDIPQVLAGKYNIYVEFLPGNWVQREKTGKTRIVFTLHYTGANGKPTDKTFQSATPVMLTSATEKVKMPVATNFEFPFANYYDRVWLSDYRLGKHTQSELNVTTRLEIWTNVSNSELNNNDENFVRSFCVDRIIFEPVKN